MKTSFRILLLTIGIFALLIALLYAIQQPNSGKGDTLIVYCGAGLRLPFEKIASEYERSTGTAIHFQFGASQAVLASAEVSKTGDLFIPGDESYVRMANEKGLVLESTPIARMKPVLVVAKGNPKGILTIDDLKRADVKCAQVNPDSAAVGKLVRQSLQEAGKWDALKEHTMIFMGTVGEVADSVKLGASDAGFIWNFMALQNPKIEIVSVPELSRTEAALSACVLKSSTKAEAARQFMAYLADRNLGWKVFEQFGFEPATKIK